MDSIEVIALFVLAVVFAYGWVKIGLECPECFGTRFKNNICVSCGTRRIKS